MRTLHQSQPRCTSHQHTWCRSAAAHARSAPLGRPVTASAFNFNFDFSPGNEVTAAPQPPTVFQLPRSARPLQSVLDAQAAAEAAQQELLVAGPLAEAAAGGNELVSNIISTYGTVQRLYHKAVLPFLERHPQYIDSPAGMSYEICRDILGHSSTPDVQPGGSLTVAELRSILAAASTAAAASGQQPMPLLAEPLLAIAYGKAKGDWHVLPDLITMLTSSWFAPDSGISNSSQGWLPALGNALGSSLMGAVKDGASASAKPDAVKLMMYSCMKPDQPLDIRELGLFAGLTKLDLLCQLGSGNGGSARVFLPAVLATLPAADQQELCAAELEMNSWRSYMHSYPTDTVYKWFGIGDIVGDLRLAFYNAAFSKNAHSMMMGHLYDIYPMDEWDPMLKVCLAYKEDKENATRAPGWNASHELLLQLLQRPSPPALSKLDMGSALEALTLKAGVTVAGIAQSVTAAELASYHARNQGVPAGLRGDLKWAVQQFPSVCVEQHTLIYLDSRLQITDYEHGGFAHLLYWVEVERMALQLTGGQVGEAAASAARSIIDSVPHSAIFARAALRCADALARHSTGSLFEERTGYVSPVLRAAVLARGEPKLAAEIQALGGQLPTKMLPQVASPFMVDARSTSIRNQFSRKSSNRSARGNSAPQEESAADAAQQAVAAATAAVQRTAVPNVQQAADMLHQQLLQPKQQPSTADIVQLLCRAGSLGPELRAFDPALLNSLREILTDGLNIDLAKDGAPLWFAAALAQLQLVEQARDSPVLADIIAGSGVLEEEYLRPYAEFMAAKRATCTALAEAVCRAGWSIQSSAAGAVAASKILTMGDTPSVSCRATLWALSSCIAGLELDGDSTSAAEDSLGPLDLAVARAVKLAQQDDRVAAGMPAGYEWLVPLSDTLRMRISTYLEATHVINVVQQIVAESGGSFQKLEPAMQAIVQAAATAAVECPGIWASSTPVMGLLQVVPLLTIRGYSRVLDQLLTQVPADLLSSTLPTAWSAAVAAATDLQLAATPAFGKQRPDVPFLLQQLGRVWEKVANRPQLALAVMQPVISAAGRLLAQHSTAGNAGAGASLQAAAQLLDAVCSLLASSSQMSLSSAGVQQPAMQGVLALLKQHPELPSLQQLQVAVCAAVRAEVTAGSGSVLEAAEQLAASGQQLSKAQLYWAAVEGAAAAVEQQQAAAPSTPIDPELLLLYWSTAVLSSAGAAPSSSVATAVVAAMAADAAGAGGLTQRLLAQPLPTAVLDALLQATQSNDAVRVVLPQLLQHALQNQQVQLLPAAMVPQLLQSALAAVTTTAAAVSFADCMQLLDLMLQQKDGAAAVSAATAQLLHAAIQSSTANKQQFEALVQHHSSSPAVSVLLCSMLQAACMGGNSESSWQLFQLLQQCSQPSQQQVQACSDLLVQQRGIDAAEATAADRAVAVWQHCCAAADSGSAAIQQLRPAAQQAVVSALVAKRQSEEALLLAQDIPELLPYLASLWQQQQQEEEGQPLNTAALLQALQMCVAAGGQQAAGAAGTLTGLLLQQDAAGAWQDSDLLDHLVQLLCMHGKAAAALQLLPACLARAGSGAAAATAIAAAAGAVAKVCDTQQQAELLQVLAKGAKPATVQDAISQALGQPAPGAVGLLLRALRDSNPGQGLGQLLTPDQLQQLCELVCSTAEDTGNSSTHFTQLPSVRQFADDCLSAEQLPGNVAAQLLNALCRQHPEVQPSAAADQLGEGGATMRSSREGLGHADSEANTAAVEQLVQVVAYMCSSQIGSRAGNDYDALEASYAEWVSSLSPEAAAAALFAAWVHRSQGSGAAVPLLCLELYQRAKPTGDSLLFDLGLMAAAEAAEYTGNWHRGEGIIAAAAKAQQQAEGSKGSRHSQQWVPSWPAACPALLSVQVHTKGVDAAAMLLLSQHEQGLLAKQQGPAVAGRKGKAAATSRDAVAATPSALLSLPAVNSFLVAAVAVAASHQQEGSDEEAESAAKAAVQVAGELFKPQLVAVSMGTAGAELLKPGSADVLLDGTSLGCLAQLYGVLGDWQQLGNIVLAAAKQQLPGVGPGGVQAVLAGAAAALNAAGRHVAAVQLLDGLIAAGVTAVSHPQLAQQLVDAADKSSEVEQ